jgi:hypothetical protein
MIINISDIRRSRNLTVASFKEHLRVILIFCRCQQHGNMDVAVSDHCDWMERMSRLRPFPTLISEYLDTLDVLTHEQSQVTATSDYLLN